ncbi:LptF/LptG family permease [Deinococcus yavapaiensis]|uniref:LptF/LptG family permease n=1 Tax=Deinococcus yavapaiensis TaxID=309889 RepID=UPI001476459B|nr:LptF/LptG family permease [Deinococcus yavapaiensis]
MPRLAWSIAREVVPLYAVGFLLFLLLSTTDLMSTIAGFMLRSQTPPLLALEFYVNYLPTILGRILPAAVVFAVLIAFGRMAKDSEFKAIAAAGVRPLSMLWPLGVIGLVVTGLTFVNANVIAPDSNVRMLSAWYRMYNSVPQVPNEKRYAHREGDSFFYAGTVQTDPKVATKALLQGILVQQTGVTYTASTGSWDAARQTWTLDGYWETRDGGSPTYVPQPREFKQGDVLRPATKPPEQLGLAQLRAKAADTSQDVRDLRAARFELYRRFADPFAALGFALAAGALGLLLPNRAWAFASVVLLILGTYIVWSLMPQLVRVGSISEMTAAWLPSVLLLLFALGMSWRLR